MARYYFDTVIDGKLHLDDEGEEFADAESAIQAAKVGAAEYVADLVAHGHTPDHEVKLVRGEDGNIAARFVILDAFGVALPK